MPRRVSDTRVRAVQSPRLRASARLACLGFLKRCPVGAAASSTLNQMLPTLCHSHYFVDDHRGRLKRCPAWIMRHNRRNS